MPNLLHNLRSDVQKRIRELEPLVKEHAELRRVLQNLPQPTKATRSVTRRARRSNGAAPSTPPGSGRRGRPRRSGSRAQEALRLVQRHPGMTVGELATRMKIKPNYLYRLLPQLQKDGKIVKRDKGYHPPADPS